MLLIDPARDWVTAADAIKAVRRSGYASPNMIAYFPRVYLRVNDGAAAHVAGGALAGLFCKLDRTHGPWTDPDQSCMSCGAVDITDEDARPLAREGLNTIATGAAGKAHLTGFVTMSQGGRARSKYSSLAIRRSCLRIVNAVDHGTRWAVFEADDTKLAKRIHSQVFAYLCSLANLGAFENNKFFVQCDAGLCKRQDSLGHGVTILLVFHPHGSSEPVSFTLHQTVAGCRVTSTAFPPVIEDCA